MNHKTDLRIVRTQSAIKEAFLKLLTEKRYEQITIQNIADEAFINRNTFYLHYIDKDDLFQKLSEQCLNELESSLNTTMVQVSEVNKDTFSLIIKEVIGSIKRNIAFYQAVMSINEIPCFSNKFKEIIKTHISTGLEQIQVFEPTNNRSQNIYIEYIVCGFIGIIHFWLNNSTMYSEDEISTYLVNIHLENVMQLLPTLNRTKTL